MERDIFTSVDFKYDNQDWNPISGTQSEERAELSKFEESYILSHKDLWDELSKH